MNVNEALMRELAEEVDRDEPDDSDALRKLSRLADTVRGLDRDIDEATEALNKLKTRRYELQTKDMVDLMNSVGIRYVGVEGGKFELSEEFHANIRADASNRDEAFAWLESHQAGDLINNLVVVALPRDAGARAERLAATLRRFLRAEVKIEKTVPWKRLTSWFKERVLARREFPDPEDEPLPVELLGARSDSIVKFVPDKKSRRKK